MFVFFGPAPHLVAAAGTDNPNGLQQEPELPTIPGLWINRKNGNRKCIMVGDTRTVLRYL